MNSSSTAIAVAGDARFYPRIATLLYMLQDQPDVAGRIPIWVFTDDASYRASGVTLEDNLAQIGIMRERDYHIHTVSVGELAALPTNGHISVATYLRFWVPRALADYERCLYLDLDLLVRRPLRPLLETDLKGNVLGAVNERSSECAQRLRLARPKAFNAGLLLIDVAKWNTEQVTHRCFDWLSRHRDSVIWLDQDALNAVLDQDILELDVRWNTLRDRLDEVSDPAIVHFNGSGKPWQFNTHHPYRDDYRQWLRRTPWPGSLMEHTKLLNRLRETPVYRRERARRSWIRKNRARTR